MYGVFVRRGETKIQNMQFQVFSKGLRGGTSKAAG